MAFDRYGKRGHGREHVSSATLLWAMSQVQRPCETRVINSHLQMRQLSPERSKGPDNHEVGFLGFAPKGQFLSVLLPFHRDGILKFTLQANPPRSDSMLKHRAPPPAVDESGGGRACSVCPFQKSSGATSRPPSAWEEPRPLEVLSRATGPEQSQPVSGKHAPKPS